MHYESTRGKVQGLTASKVIELGIASDGGLFLPEKIVSIASSDIMGMMQLNYRERAYRIINEYMDDYSACDLKECLDAAYTDKIFSHPDIAPIRQLNDNVSFLELWHGPTCAFKDFALQLLPKLLTKARGYSKEDKEIVILVATSGDTGKAAMEGFKNVAGTRVIVFFPSHGVSEMQKMQMITQEGRNIDCFGIAGNFDDAQSTLKSIFVNPEFNKKIQARGYQLSSANSINWGRLVPQIVPYFSGYADMAKNNQIRSGDAINIVVPSGNFGNFLGAYLAKEMGLPVHKLICASNENKILTDFFHTGTYDLSRDFKITSSPAMDILMSSNLERFLYLAAGRKPEKINGWMKNAKEKNSYTIDAATFGAIKKTVWADFAKEEEVSLKIKSLFSQYAYLIDTHTAVGACVYDKYVAQTKDLTKTLIVSTASPYKFNQSVARAIFPKNEIDNVNEFELMKMISKKASLEIPDCLNCLDKKPILHGEVCRKDEMIDCIDKVLISRVNN
jgi:threonine synthase